MRFEATFEKEGCVGSVEFDFYTDAPLSQDDVDTMVDDFARSLSRWPLSYVLPIEEAP